MAKPATEKPAERSDPKYKGVRKRKWGRWVSEIRLPNSRERIWLGSYDSAEKAARAFDAALYCLRGSSAQFNFPDNPPDIPEGRSLTPPEVQAAAADFANLELEPPERSHQSMPELKMMMESPSPSVSDGMAQTDSDVILNGSFFEMFGSISSVSDAYEYGLFPGFDDLFSPVMPTNTIDYEEENFDGTADQHSFLWNF